MDRVVALNHEEGVRLDPARLRDLVADLGPGAVASLAGLALDEVATRMSRMEDHYADGEMRQIRRHAMALSRRAASIGMITMARVAADVGICAARGDMVAFGATWTRLQRITDRSIRAISGLRDAGT